MPAYPIERDSLGNGFTVNVLLKPFDDRVQSVLRSPQRLAARQTLRATPFDSRKADRASPRTFLEAQAASAALAAAIACW